MIRKEYPRPQFVRAEWMNLNGEWEFEFDDRDQGVLDGWYRDRPLSSKIHVPFCYQSKLSGIGTTEFHDVVWYRRSFTLPADNSDQRWILHFGAVDYEAKVWVNGLLVAAHEGGHTPFSADITFAAKAGENEVVVRAQDYSEDVCLPRGKQYWKEKSDLIFYTRTTGIWQSVWLEPVAESYLQSVRYTPDIDNNEIGIRTLFEGRSPQGQDLRLRIHISFNGEIVSEDEFAVREADEMRTIRLHDFNDHGLGRWWTPEKPNLYDIRFTLLKKEQTIDDVRSYFGMRKISVEDRKICLNNRPYYMKMVLDQGYFPGGILTAPTGEDLRRDVELTKELGFNGARKHQKVEDPLYLYWCDKLGLLVWGEMANAYQYSEKYARRIVGEWQEAIERDYNHPSIVVWVPLNESWGIPNVLVDKRQQHHGLAMYHLTKSLDPTRLVISNDGWEHLKSDIATIHDYEWREEILAKRYASVDNAINSIAQNRWIYVPGFPYEGEPVQLTEFGGISFRAQEKDKEGWGYSAAVDSEDFFERLIHVMRPVLQSPALQGYCYTQLTDVEQEMNGLLNFDRTPKLPIEAIRRLNEGLF